LTERLLNAVVDMPTRSSTRQQATYDGTESEIGVPAERLKEGQILTQRVDKWTGPIKTKFETKQEAPCWDFLINKEEWTPDCIRQFLVAAYFRGDSKKMEAQDIPRTLNENTYYEFIYNKEWEGSKEGELKGYSIWFAKGYGHPDMEHNPGLCSPVNHD
jgi:hypothetical protein